MIGLERAADGTRGREGREGGRERDGYGGRGGGVAAEDHSMYHGTIVCQ